MTSDMNSVISVIQSVYPNKTEKSVRDCTRLDKYSNHRHRPILVKLACSCDAAFVLANRRKLSTSPVIYIKQHMFTKERADENILLQERHSLINSGVDRNIIEIYTR